MEFRYRNVYEERISAFSLDSVDRKQAYSIFSIKLNPSFFSYKKRLKQIQKQAAYTTYSILLTTYFLLSF